MCVGGGGVNFEGETEKADLIKGGIKFDQNIVRGEWNYEFSRRNTFFDNLNV